MVRALNRKCGFELRPQRPELGLGGELHDLMLAHIALIPLVSDPQRVDAAAREASGAVEQRVIIGQEASTR